MLRAVEEIVRRRAFQHRALVHEDDAVGHFAGKAHLVRDADHGHAVLGQIAHHQQHFAHHFRVQRAGGLVEQDHRWPQRQRTRDRHALLLAARQLAGNGVRLVRQAHAFQQRHGAFARGGGRQLLELHRRQGAVFQHRQVRKQVELLKHEADAGAQRVHVLPRRMHVLAVHQNAAALDFFQPVDGADQRGFARTRRAADHHHFARGDGFVDVHQRVVVAIPFVDVLKFDHAARLDAVWLPRPRRARRRST